ncbi:LacI family DNA-binding transcriptional regulator [Prevotella sp. oral taxon 299]|uniref:LacI family DNA-binding transcriptional regulator n=1 Tax=Prevotella sp. oral taxon 299 TaxID=652716 RepID=UPI0001C3F693|nr:LacI family DNA-binding transcriptional regulator [Prevotella sp. oral taxon 299]EFC71487.1 hypothetical protein HMPREF0669_00159 [Prevotella sp. oral taxon 299 str. F0039]
MKDSPPLTMKDIAQELGVSVATVSRALKDSPKISAKKREEIKAFAKEKNFCPNIVAKNLRNSKTEPIKLIGVIIPKFSHSYFASILSGIEEKASTKGYHIIATQSNENYEQEVEICKSLLENKVCGIIVSQAKNTFSYDHFQNIINHNIPLVFYDRICTGINSSRVVVDDYTGAYTAVEYLIKTGCKRIAFYGSSMKLEITKNRYNGYKDALIKNGLSLDERFIKQCDNRTDAEDITPHLLTLEDRPDAFFAINDETAIGILYTVKRMKLHVPEDVSICGFSNGGICMACDPMLTSVDQHGFALGEEAAQVLIDKVEGVIPESKIEKRIVRTRLILRGTTR